MLIFSQIKGKVIILPHYEGISTFPNYFKIKLLPDITHPAQQNPGIPAGLGFTHKTHGHRVIITSKSAIRFLKEGTND